MINDAIEIYASIIEGVRRVNTTPFYDRYYDYLVKWGFLEEARTVLTKKLRFGKLSMEEQKQTAQKIKDNIENVQTLSQEAKGRF